MMKKISDCALCRSVRQTCRELSRYRICAKYDISVCLAADGQAASPERTHRFEGNACHAIWKLAFCFAAAVVLFSWIRGIAGLFQKR